MPADFIPDRETAWAEVARLLELPAKLPAVVDEKSERPRFEACIERSHASVGSLDEQLARWVVGYWAASNRLDLCLTFIEEDLKGATPRLLADDFMDLPRLYFFGAFRRHLFAADEATFQKERTRAEPLFSRALGEAKLFGLRDQLAYAFARDERWVRAAVRDTEEKAQAGLPHLLLASLTDPALAKGFARQCGFSINAISWLYDLVESLEGGAVPVLLQAQERVRRRGASVEKPIQNALALAQALAKAGPSAAPPTPATKTPADAADPFTPRLVWSDELTERAEIQLAAHHGLAGHIKAQLAKSEPELFAQLQNSLKEPRSNGPLAEKAAATIQEHLQKAAPFDAALEAPGLWLYGWDLLAWRVKRDGLRAGLELLFHAAEYSENWEQLASGSEGRVLHHHGDRSQTFGSRGDLKGPLEFLVAAALAAPEKERQAAYAHAATLRDGAPLAFRTLLTRFTRNPDWAREDALAIAAHPEEFVPPLAGDGPTALDDFSLLVTDAAALKALASMEDPPRPKPLLTLRVLGLAGLPLVLRQIGDGAFIKDELAEALSVVEGVEAAEVLAELLAYRPKDKQGAAATARAYFTRRPDLAVVVLGKHVGGKSKLAALAEPLVTRALEDNPGLQTLLGK